MTVNIEAIKTALFEWASQQIAIPVVFAMQNAPRPKSNFCTLHLMNFVNKGEDYILTVDSNGIATIKGEREFTVSIQTYGSGAFAHIEQLKQSLYKYTVQQAFLQNDFVFVRHESISNLTDILDGRYEERASLEITFGTSVEYTDDIGLIESVGFNAKYVRGEEVAREEDEVVTS